jgi:hypothetical protein
MLTGLDRASPDGPLRRPYRLLVQGLNIVLVAGSLAWVTFVFPDIADPAILRVAGRLAQGEKYDPFLLRDIIAGNLPAARRQCNATSLRQLLLLQIAVADETVRSTDLQQADVDVAGVGTVSKALVMCAPTESVGWFGMYWSDIRQEGFGPRAVALLAQSYRMAPHEAWIQLIRAPLALRSFNALPPDLKDGAVQDFQDIFRSRLFPSAAALYQAATANAQTTLLDQTCALPEAERLLFLHFVTEIGLKIRHHCYPSDDKPAYMHD